jgi:hypothetical protein
MVLRAAAGRFPRWRRDTGGTNAAVAMIVETADSATSIITVDTTIAVVDGDTPARLRRPSSVVVPRTIPRLAEAGQRRVFDLAMLLLNEGDITFSDDHQSIEWEILQCAVE